MVTFIHIFHWLIQAYNITLHTKKLSLPFLTQSAGVQVGQECEHQKANGAPANLLEVVLGNNWLPFRGFIIEVLISTGTQKPAGYIKHIIVAL